MQLAVLNINKNNLLKKRDKRDFRQQWQNRLFFHMSTAFYNMALHLYYKIATFVLKAKTKYILMHYALCNLHKYNIWLNI